MVLRYPSWKKFIVLTISLGGILFAMPNFFPNGKIPLPIFDRLKTVSLGLDLQGGAHLLLEVDLSSVIENSLQNLREETRQLLKKQKIVANRPQIENKLLVVQIVDPNAVNQFVTSLKKANSDISIAYVRGGEVGISLKETAIRNLQIDAVDRSIEIIRRRIDESGTRDPLIQRQGSNRIVVQLPGVKNPDMLKSLIGKTAKLTFHLVNDQIDPNTTKIPIGYAKLPSHEKDADKNPMEHYMVTARALLSGEHLKDSGASFDNNNKPAVAFTFDSAGAFKFGNITGQNIGRRLAIVLDDEVVSAPRIQSAIIGGDGIITGSFTIAEANELGILLRAGALPAALEIVEERTVGPGLGSDSIEAGKVAFTVGLLAVAVFMFLAYGRFGLFSNIALAINITLIFAVLSILQATLTLPGIAGIILTIGMAVDANVLIFERIREEYRNGRSPVDAIDSGFQHAFVTILDANITSLVAAFLLFILGAGPIKGFAVTLSIGVFTSVFSAVMLSRYLVFSWVARNPDCEELPLT